MLPFYPSHKEVSCKAMIWLIPNILTAIRSAAEQTAITCNDYFRKVVPYFKEDK
jgi:hypothetical protein